MTSKFQACPPAASTVLQDDERCGVARLDFEPDADTGRHRRGMAYLVTPMTERRFMIEVADVARSEILLIPRRGQTVDYLLPMGIARTIDPHPAADPPQSPS